MFERRKGEKLKKEQIFPKITTDDEEGEEELVKKLFKEYEKPN